MSINKQQRMWTVVAGMASILVIGAVAAGSYITSHNAANQYERSIVASHRNNQNVLGNCTVKIQEIAQIPAMYRDDLAAVIKVAVQKQGASVEGGQMVNQWVRESRLVQMDPTMYNKIGTAIESCSNEFTHHQTILLDKKRSYETQLGTFWTGRWMRFAGFPKIVLSDYDIVVATETKDTFDSGIRNPIKLR